MLNAMTVDLEDWAQGVLDPRHPITSRVAANLDRVLALLDRCGVQATFFALGKVCEAFPELLPRIRDAGHEIGSHGYGHGPVYTLTPELFAADIHRSMEIIGAQTGVRPTGYRAPAFSITYSTLWAGPMLAAVGFRYSSSVFPIAGRRYGIPQAPRYPYVWPGCRLVEFPLTTLRALGRNWPGCGGGYTRLWPVAIMATALRQANRAGHPGVIYMHPYELAAGEVASFCRDGFRVTWRRRFTQELWRSRVAGRLARLFNRFEFGPMDRVIEQCTPLPAEPSPSSHPDGRPAVSCLRPG